MMMSLHAQSQGEAALACQAAVALIDPRQVRKTTLAPDTGSGRPSLGTLRSLVCR